MVALTYPPNRRNLPTNYHSAPVTTKETSHLNKFSHEGSVAGILVLGLMACSVELQLRWNEVRGVQSLDFVS